MPTLVIDPQPQELAALIERRRRLGQDLNNLLERIDHHEPHLALAA
jgi:hypothetical protein